MEILCETHNRAWGNPVDIFVEKQQETNFFRFFPAAGAPLLMESEAGRSDFNLTRFLHANR